MINKIMLQEKVKNLEEDNSLKSAQIKTHEFNLNCLVAANESKLNEYIHYSL